MAKVENEGHGRLLNEVWFKVRAKHFFPELPKPSIERFIGDTALEIKNKTITLNQHFLEENSTYLPLARIMEALLDHCVAHYTVCPWDFYTYLMLYKRARDVLNDKRMALTATSYFMDIVVDTYCFKEKDTPLPDLYRHMKEKDALSKVIHALYQKIWGIDLNIRGYDDFTAKLSQIPFPDRKRWPQSIYRFSKIIRCLLSSSEEMMMAPMGQFGFGNFSSMETDSGLSEFIMLSRNPQDFQELIEDFGAELVEKLDFEGGMGFSFGRRPEDANAQFYMRLAENYSLPLNKEPVDKSGTLYPFSHCPWEVGKSVLDIDPWTSFGKIMPGLTQTWERREGDTFGSEEGTPNCIIIIDSSGSMVNPKKYLSQAVLGAACAADAYLRNDAMVAVYNFSDANANQCKVLPFTRQRAKIYRELCHYFAGGTRLNIDDVDILQDPSKPDIFIITDMKITNLNEFIEYLNKLENRVTAVHLGKSDDADRFKQSTTARKNISFYFVQRNEDIPKIVLGKIGEYFNPLSGI
jgi:hypothetical protein